MNSGTDSNLAGVAVIGMSCRFPGARTPAAFWDNLLHARESITFFSDSELLRAGVPEALLKSPQYVKAAPVLDDAEKFDADFFRCSPREAAAMDPQHRFFLECAWEALEDAGYDPLKIPNRVGVYAGALVNTYLLANVVSGALPLSLDFSDFLETLIASDKDFLATRISYKLNLKGPSLTVQTACSTGLVAVHLACQSLLNGECETALAGAASIRFPHRAGYLSLPGGLVSPDGHCRPFSDRSQGTVFGSGVGVVVLKRLEDALADGDSIHAVIRGTAVNNDGSSKLSYAAPAVDGHAEVVAEALAVAGVEASTIGYIETHGTATDLGDPVEVAALTQAFRLSTSRKQFCAIGSVKSNLGHLDAAAGIAGLIKAVLALERGRIPATLHFERPNPKLNLESSPFFVNSSSLPWNPASGPRRAGVSSLGVGGTNAHAVLEEPPRRVSAIDNTGNPHLLVLSARSTTALEALVSRYLSHLSCNPDLALTDACYTAAKGRHHFDRRVAIVARNLTEAAQQLAHIPAVDRKLEAAPRIAFLFSGQGSQYAGMAQRLYEAYPVFRESLETAQELVRPFMDIPLLNVISPENTPVSKLNQTLYAQPAILAISLALSDLWQSWGVTPTAVIGHSLGEYAAAAVAGVFRREDVFRLVCERARLMQALPGDGAMAAVRAPAGRTLAFVRDTPNLEIAALNSPEEVVITGQRGIVEAAVRCLEAQGSSCRLLAVSHAFHSRLMEPALDRLQYLVSTMDLSPPRLPIVSNLTGQLAGSAMADPAYWRRHARQTVRFSDGMQTLHREGCGLFVEAGPGSTLLGFGASCLPRESGWHASLRKDSNDAGTILESLGRLYSRGVEVDWNSFYEGRRYRRVPLPVYPFEGKRHVVGGEAAVPAASPTAKSPLESTGTKWLYELQWRSKRLEAAASHEARPDRVVLVGASGGFASRLRNVLLARGVTTILLPSASHCSQAIAAESGSKTAVVYLSALDIAGASFDQTERVTCEAAELATGLAKCGATARLWMVTRGTQPIRGAVLRAGVFQSTLFGMARGIEVECPEIWGGSVDLEAEESGEVPTDEAEMLALEVLSGGSGETRIAFRGGHRLVCRLVKSQARHEPERVVIHADATYLISGGTGGLGPAVAKWLIDRGARHVVLTSRSGIASTAIETLRARCPDLRVARADAGDLGAMQDLLHSLNSAGPPLRGIFHLSGFMHYQSAGDVTAASVHEALQPKAKGAWLLHELTKAIDMDFFVMFSSMSSILAGSEMSAYAASNAFLDSLAYYRRSAGLSALTVNWGPWSGGGMGEARVSERLRSGVALLDPASALECLAFAMNSGNAQAVAVDVDWSVFRPLYEARRPSSFLEDLAAPTGTAANVPSSAGQTASTETPELVRLRSAPPLQQYELLERYVRTEVFAVLGIDADAGLDAGTRLFEAGLDSLRAIELRNKLQSGLRCPLPATLTLNHPTIEAITDFLLRTVPSLQKPGVRRSEKLLKPCLRETT